MAKTIIDVLVYCQMAEKLHKRAFGTMRDIAARKQCLKYTLGDPQKSAEAFTKAVEEHESKWLQHNDDLPEHYEGSRYLLKTALESGVDVAGKTADEIQDDLTRLHQFRNRAHKLVS